MAISFIASSKQEDSINATTRIITVPAGVQDGDFILLVVTYAGGSTTNSATGLTGLIKVNDNQYSGISSAVYYKQNALASDANTAIAVTLSSSLRTSLVCLVFRGVSTSGSPFDVNMRSGGLYGSAVLTPDAITSSVSSLHLQIASGSKTTIFDTPWNAPETLGTVVDAYTSGAVTGNSGVAIGWASAESQSNTSVGGDVWVPPASVNWATWTLSLDSGSLGTAPAVSAGTNSSVAAGAATTLTGTATGPTPTSWVWTQTAGPVVMLSGSGATRTFTAPTSQTNETITFSLQAYSNSIPSNLASLTVSVGAHKWWSLKNNAWNAFNVGSVAGQISPFFPAEAIDVPVFSYAAVGSSAPSTIVSTAGWQREKRVGVTTTAPGGIQSSTAALDTAGDTRFKYSGVPAAIGYTANPAQYVSTDYKPGGSSQNAYWLFNVEFTTSSPTVELRLNAPVANPRLGLVLVNDKLVSETAVYATATAGNGYAAKLTFSSSRPRTIKIIGLNHNMGRFGGIAVETGYAISRPASNGKRIAVIGDSWVNGALGSAPLGANSVETFAWRLARMLGGDEFIQAGIGGTGWVKTINAEPSSNYAGRIPSVMALNPDVIIFTGGRNDSEAGLQVAIEATLDATSSVAERYVISTTAGGQSLVRTAMEAAATTKSVRYIDVSNSSIAYGTDGIHPTFAGHKAVAITMYNKINNLEPLPPPEPAPIPPTGQASPGLFFQLPEAAVSSTKKVFAHFFGPYPISIDNSTPASDYYTNNYLAVNGEGGIWASKGGYLRNRPMGRAPITGDYRFEDSKSDIEQAREAGIDGFFCNIMGTSGANWDRYIKLADTASAIDSGFKIVPMIDTNGNVGTATAAHVAAKLAEFSGKASAWYINGRFVVASYKADGKTQAWWQAIFSIMQSTYGLDVYFFGVYSSFSQSANYTAITEVASTWGAGADPNIQKNYSDMAGQARARGEKWMAPVWWQDVRPRSNLFDEACNTESLREAWIRAIKDDADYIQMCTWSDYSEGSEFNRSVARGAVAADLSAYYIAKLKTGAFPTIQQDVIYLSHRNQLTTVSNFSGGQTEFMAHWNRPNRSAVRNTVETLTFLVAPANVTVNIGSNTYTYTAPAGMHAQLHPLANGQISVVAQRAGLTVTQITSPVIVTATPINQDRGYYSFSSIRGTAGQYRIPG